MKVSGSRQLQSAIDGWEASDQAGFTLRVISRALFLNRQG
jgi:hypothetical protein